MKTAHKTKRTVSEVRQTPIVKHIIKHNIIMKRNPYTKSWYIMEEESSMDYMKLRYSTIEFPTKNAAYQALENNKVAFNKWEIF
jgi:hypothetical protein